MLEIEGWANASVFLHGDYSPAVKADNQQIPKHIPCPVVINAIGKSEAEWGDSREGGGLLQVWVGCQGKPLWRSDIDGDPNGWGREPWGHLGKVGPHTGVTGTFFLGVFKKHYCALLIFYCRRWSIKTPKENIYYQTISLVIDARLRLGIWEVVSEPRPGVVFMQWFGVWWSSGCMAAKSTGSVLRLLAFESDFHQPCGSGWVI